MKLQKLCDLTILVFIVVVKKYLCWYSVLDMKNLNLLFIFVYF